MKPMATILAALLICLLSSSSLFADPLDDAKTAIQNQDYTKAVEILIPLSEQENVEAQTMLGSMYISGQGAAADPTKGLNLITAAAKKGYEPAKIRAFSLNIELANSGDTGAMFNVGYMCFNGWGGTYEPDVCLKWLENAGDMGHERSAKILTKIYTEGMFNVIPDSGKTAYWKEQEMAIVAGIEGSWEGSLPSMGGPNPMPVEVTYKFKKEGEILSGIFINKGFGNKKSFIKEGKIDGNEFSFYVESSFGGNKIVTNYTGVFYGNTIKLTCTMPGGPDGKVPLPVTFLAKRTI
ncbi:MAG: sel1 repeat family protein [Deltaproteobacteria bacterium]|nr:sel1 repeat family protein [Deltaproteobacteria bacterium]